MIPLVHQTWIFEVDAAHSSRLATIIAGKDPKPQREEVTVARPNPGQEVMRLIYSSQPPSMLPPETLKYLNRVFKVHGCCSDLGWLMHHPYTRDLVQDSTVVFAVKTHPKSIAPMVIEALSCREQPSSLTAAACTARCACTYKARCQFRASETAATHLLHIVFSSEEGLFRWGVTRKQDLPSVGHGEKGPASSIDDGGDGDRDRDSTQPQQSNYSREDYLMLCAGGIKQCLCASRGNAGYTPVRGNFDVGNSTSLNNDDENPRSSHINSGRSGSSSGSGSTPLPPVCRAYYKIQEALEFHFPRLGWPLPRTDGGSVPPIAVDVGASPGGWTQFLQAVGYRVLALDPGELHPSVLSLPHVRWVSNLLGSPEAEAVMADELKHAPLGRVLMAVCDVNVNPEETVRLLVGGILPLMLTPVQGAAPAGGALVVAYVVFTLKLRKNAKETHVTLNEVKCVDALRAACACYAWNQTVAMHRAGDTDEGAGQAAVRIVYDTVHLCANSKNERTMLVKIEVEGRAS